MAAEPLTLTRVNVTDATGRAGAWASLEQPTSQDSAITRVPAKVYRRGASIEVLPRRAVARGRPGGVADARTFTSRWTDRRYGLLARAGMRAFSSVQVARGPKHGCERSSSRHLASRAPA